LSSCLVSSPVLYSSFYFSLSSLRFSSRCIGTLVSCSLHLSPVAPAPLSRWVAELSSGTAAALLLRGGADIVGRVRDLCGPYIPDVARHLRPESLRAKYGVDGVRNAVHCTDLPLDGPLECKFLFEVL
jgi:hypothetical protein